MNNKIYVSIGYKPSTKKLEKNYKSEVKKLSKEQIKQIIDQENKRIINNAII